MKYMLLINAGPADSAEEAEAQAVCEFTDWMKFDEQIQGAGVVVASHALADMTTATRVRVTADGERVITTDGPFAEAREVLGGYHVIDDVLLVLTPSPVVALNRAAAVAMRDGPEAGLALLDELAGEPRLRGYHPYAASRADLLRRLGRRAEAAQAYREAIGLAETDRERALLRRLLDVVEVA